MRMELQCSSSSLAVDQKLHNKDDRKWRFSRICAPFGFPPNKMAKKHLTGATDGMISDCRSGMRDLAFTNYDFPVVRII